MVSKKGQYYRWMRGSPCSSYYRMIVRVDCVRGSIAYYTVVERSPEHLASKVKYDSEYKIGYKDCFRTDKQNGYGEGWELVDDFEYWVKECQEKAKKSGKKQTKS